MLHLDNHYTVPPEFIEFSIPFVIKKILVDNKETEISNRSTIQFGPHAKEVVVFR